MAGRQNGRPLWRLVVLTLHQGYFFMYFMNLW